MKIRFLGTSHGIAEKNQFCSSALISIGDKHYVIDAGAPLMTLLKNHDVAYEDVQGIFITHTHSDHFMGLVEFTYQINNIDQWKFNSEDFSLYKIGTYDQATGTIIGIQPEKLSGGRSVVKNES